MPNTMLWERQLPRNTGFVLDVKAGQSVRVTSQTIIDRSNSTGQELRAPPALQLHEVSVALLAAAIGSFNSNLAPRGLRIEAKSFPPWLSTIERLIDKPIPIP